ncbi:MAG: hypothetical protein AAF525_22770, partial [Pseudomonadota bacterium]
MTNEPTGVSASQASDIPSTTQLDLPVAPKIPLSINVVVFDYDVPERLLAPIREAESGYMAVTLANVLQDSGQWAGVYVLPIANEYSEVQVRARILHSDASLLHLQVAVHDAMGRVWIDRGYRAQMADEAYGTDALPESEVFAHLYHQIANDVAAFQRSLAPSDRQDTRQVSMMRFAETLAPNAFSGYLGTSEIRIDDALRTVYELEGLPARDDPVFRQVQEIQVREQAIVELIDTQYRRFHQDLLSVYPYWRRYLFELSGDAGERRRESGNWAATEAVYRQYEEARLNEDRLRVLTKSFRDESRSTSAELEGTVVELSGSLAQQYERWRERSRSRPTTLNSSNPLQGKSGTLWKMLMAWWILKTVARCRASNGSFESTGPKRP